MANAEAPKKAEPVNKTVTVVINNRAGIEIGQMPHRGTDMHRRVILGDSISFLPGLNLIDTETLAILRQNALFEAKFTSVIKGSLAPENQGARVGRTILQAGPALPAVHPLAKLEAKDAIEMVDEANEEQLQQFRGEETREAVLRAILRKIDQLDAAARGEAVAAEG